MKYNQLKMIAVAIGLLMTSGCSGKHLTTSADNTLSLEGCSPLPNCVSSTTWVLYNKTSQFELLVPREVAWPIIKEVVSNIPRTEIVESGDVYIHAKCKSLVFRFVDNLELLLHPGENTISVRSSSMIAIFDLGVNRWRIHKLRKQLEELKIIKKE
jgi:uncharacterized protein (DUF1499 family)